MSSPLRRALGIVSTRWRDPSTCEACGSEFTCGATLAGCWCTEIKLSDEARADLRSRYKKCLCRSCLERAGAAQQLRLR
jgi:Cysteine-rich CWC